MMTRDHDGTTPLGWRWWRLSIEEKDRFGKEYPRQWRIDWDYVACDPQAMIGRQNILMSAGRFHRLLADQEFELCRAARDG